MTDVRKPLTFVQLTAFSSKVYAFDSEGTVYVATNESWRPVCEFSRKVKREDMTPVPEHRVPVTLRRFIEEHR